MAKPVKFKGGSTSFNFGANAKPSKSKGGGSGGKGGAKSGRGGRGGGS